MNLRVLNSKHIINSAHKGAGILMVALITAVLIAFISVGIVKIHQYSFNSSKVSHTLLQAEQYADAEVNVINATAYSSLAAKSKKEISGSNGFYSEVLLSAERNTSGINERSVTVNVYCGQEVEPYCSKVVIKADGDLGVGSELPIGAIIAWPSSTTPTEAGVWLLCNGGTFSSTTYSKLYNLLGTTTLPNLNGRFLEGTTSSPGSTKSAGLPNITGSFKSTEGGNQFTDMEKSATTYSGALVGTFGGTYNIVNSSPTGTYLVGFSFDASKSNSIYGASTTVQPASYLVRYYIKAN